MSKSSQSLIKIIKSRLPSCSEKRLGHIDKITRLPSDSLIPDSVSSAPETDDETKNFVLCFDYLDWDECDFETINKASSKAIIELFKNATSTAWNKIADLKIRDTIRRGENKELERVFSSLPPDVDKIHEFTVSDGGRIFAFIVIETFYIVAIKTRHINTR